MTIGPKITELRLKKKVISDSRKKLENLGHVHKRVAIHLRVTDASGSEHYNFPGPQYFQNAMQHFRKKWANVTFLVFSDNPVWCKQQSLFIGEDVQVKERGSGDSTAEKNNDFALMSACDGFINSIGTFGWWAGHFSSQNGGEVVYFKNVVNTTKRIDGRQLREEDLYPPHWIGLKAPALEHKHIDDGHKVLVQDLKGDVLARPSRATLKSHNISK